MLLFFDVGAVVVKIVFLWYICVVVFDIGAVVVGMVVLW